ncbi:hypothetical protein BDR05DRAFT_305429 [Suillus weaverae]|nr:hypothetical protein BDR05DRAFT_305429 [Suillus weaverae]
MHLEGRHLFLLISSSAQYFKRSTLRPSPYIQVLTLPRSLVLTRFTIISVYDLAVISGFYRSAAHLDTFIRLSLTRTPFFLIICSILRLPAWAVHFLYGPLCD